MSIEHAIPLLHGTLVVREGSKGLTLWQTNATGSRTVTLATVEEMDKAIAVLKEARGRIAKRAVES